MRMSVPAGASEVYIGRVSLEVVFVLADGSVMRKRVTEDLKHREYIAVDDIRDACIEDFLSSSYRHKVAIMEAGIQTVGDLLQLSTYDLYNMLPNGEASRASIRNLQKLLQDFGLALDDDLDEKVPTDWSIPLSNAPESDMVYLSYGMYNKLKNKIGVSALSDLTKYTPEKLLEFWGIGEKTVFEIGEIMARYGLSLQRSDD